MKKMLLSFAVVIAAFIGIVGYRLNSSVDISKGSTLVYDTEESKGDDKENTDEASSDNPGDASLGENPEDTVLEEAAVNLDEEKAEDAEITQTPKKRNTISVNTDPNSIGVLVNRDYLIDKDYVPGDLVVPNVRFSYYGVYEKSFMREIAAYWLERLFKAAERDGMILEAVSAYRSYETQISVHNGHVDNLGRDEAENVSAEAGTSEHETGLCIDISCQTLGDSLEESFGVYEEGIWVAQNAYKYGYVIRYPYDKEAVTGYDYEPWHIRYVGKRLALRLHKKNWCLEEYYQNTLIKNEVDVTKDEEKFAKLKEDGLVSFETTIPASAAPVV
ncbi:MAG: M15 family metallopeptidase [Lachnospiraceae bacterium]|nr:M15 family metallopeptidase [Lachnospiraceae bacterium]